MRKLHSNSFAARLQPEQKDELMLGLNHGYLSEQDAAEVAGEWIGRKVSRTAIANWFARHRLEWRMGKAKESADEAMANAPKDMDDAARKAIGYQRMVAVLGALSPMEVVAFERNQLAREKQDLEKKKLELDREKFEAMQARQTQAQDTLENETLTPEQKSARLKEIFGLK